MAQQTDYPVRVEADYPERSSRLLALLGAIFLIKSVLLIPHYIVLYIIGAVASIAFYIGYWIVLFTGRYPRGLFDFILGWNRWSTRVCLYLCGMTDRYPPFRLS